MSLCSGEAIAGSGIALGALAVAERMPRATSLHYLRLRAEQGCNTLLAMNRRTCIILGAMGHLKIGVWGSGNGSDFRAILSEIHAGRLDAEAALVTEGGLRTSEASGSVMARVRKAVGLL